jgi:hypothetical protein
MYGPDSEYYRSTQAAFWDRPSIHRGQPCMAPRSPNPVFEHGALNAASTFLATITTGRHTGDLPRRRTQYGNLIPIFGVGLWGCTARLRGFD